MNRPVTIPAAADYPCPDGRPMAESDFQLEPLVYAITALRAHLRRPGTGLPRDGTAGRGAGWRATA